MRGDDQPTQSRRRSCPPDVDGDEWPPTARFDHQAVAVPPAAQHLAQDTVLQPVPGDTTTLRTAFGCFPSGVTAVCALEADHAPLGMAASSFVSVSLTPPLVAVCVQLTSTSWPRLRRCARLGLSVLAEGQQRECLSLSAKGDRFALIGWTATQHGSVLIDGAALWLECALEQEVPAGDHVIALLRIEAMHTNLGVPPLIFHGSRFRRLTAEMGSLGVAELADWLTC